MSDIYKIEHLPITNIQKNPDNPRLIKGDQFRSLCRSLEESPELFEARPLLVVPENGHFKILGGNMRFEAAKKLDCAYVVNLQGDEPRIPPDLLTSFAGLTSRLDDNTLLTVASHATIEGIADPNVVKVVLDDRGRALYFSRSAIPYDRDGSGPATFLKHVGIYGFSRESLQRYCSFPEGTLERIEKLEQLRVLENGYDIMVGLTEDQTIGVDTPEDAKRFEEALSFNR